VSDELKDREGPERSYLDLVRRMAAHQEFFYPLAAAWRKDPNSYRMARNQFLEDVHLEALDLYCRRQHETEKVFRPAPGEKGWDLEFGGSKISYKTTTTPVGSIAVIWNPDALDNREFGGSATKDSKTALWEFDHTIAFQTAGYGKVTATIGGVTFQLTGLTGDPDQELGAGPILAVDCPEGTEARVLDLIPPQEGATRISELDYESLRIDVRDLEVDRPANHIELFQLADSSGQLSLLADLCRTGSVLRIDWVLRPALYLFPKELMGRVPVRRGNKAWVVTQATVRDKLIRDIAVRHGLYVPMPGWWGAMVPPPTTSFLLYMNQDSEIITQRGIGR
jgi:hypothetical protein